MSQSGFRQSFGSVQKCFNWFPKHMNTGIKQMQAKLRSVDCVVELHDARIPLSGRNPNFSHLFVGEKPHIVVLNKADLITYSQKKKIKEIYEKSVTKNLLFTNCKNDRDTGVRKIVPLMKNLIENSNRFHRQGLNEYNAMIIGIPNVGKSSLINIVRAKNLKIAKALQVAPAAGVTKCVHMKVRISEKPTIFLYDTPGILTPRVEDPISALKLAACGSFLDHEIGELLIADYMLFVLNQERKFKYVEVFGLEEPCDCITTVLTKGAIHLNRMQKLYSTTGGDKLTRPDFHYMATLFMEKFRSTEFGHVVFDEIENFVDWEEPGEQIDLKYKEVYERSSNK